MKQLSTLELTSYFTVTWKYFYNCFTAGMFNSHPHLASELQHTLRGYERECKARGIQAVPYTVTSLVIVKPDMTFH